MYEVEKTISFGDDFLRKIANLGSLTSEKTFTDRYYDTKQYDLISKSFWLRERAGRWELKIYSSDENEMSTSREITNEVEICEILDLPRIGLERGLQQNNFSPFCTLTSTRRRYTVAGLSVDIDEVSGENFSYKIGEVELEVENKSDITKASSRIEQFIKDHELATGRTPGKVIKYLKDAKPEIYRMLVAKGIVQDF